MAKQQITYYRERVDYKNSRTSGEIVESVIFNTPELSYKFHIFILHNGIQTKKTLSKKFIRGKKDGI